ncbi:hypothetical protein, partial [Streptomyces virginiae]|uniref:hypothetical protein n=1 Tax=Streptomyces virginiae TaxID=1961 RepID=UPI0036150A13
LAAALHGPYGGQQVGGLAAELRGGLDGAFAFGLAPGDPLALDLLRGQFGLGLAEAAARGGLGPGRVRACGGLGLRPALRSGRVAGVSGTGLGGGPCGAFPRPAPSRNRGLRPPPPVPARSRSLSAAGAAARGARPALGLCAVRAISGIRLACGLRPIRVFRGSGARLAYGLRPIRVCRVSGARLACGLRPIRVFRVSGIRLACGLRPIRVFRVSGGGFGSVRVGLRPRRVIRVSGGGFGLTVRTHSVLQS